jgi:hypothetical protein
LTFSSTASLECIYFLPSKDMAWNTEPNIMSRLQFYLYRPRLHHLTEAPRALRY